MKRLKVLHLNAWDAPVAQQIQEEAVASLEEGQVLFFPALSFGLTESEKIFLAPEKVDPKSKNISYDYKINHVNGTLFEGEDKERLKEMLRRYHLEAQAFMNRLIPHYQHSIALGKTSFRPVEIFGRQSSYRKDDTRLHVDSFPSNPTKGRRILRLFTNVNPQGKPRIWRLGEPFADVVQKFLPQAKKQIPGVAKLYQLLGITKDYRTPYDHYMLQIHDSMKFDQTYQNEVSQEEVHFPSGCSWMVYTDQVSHAAMSGQHVFEQTFHLPLMGLKNEQTAPARILEKALKRALV